MEFNTPVDIGNRALQHCGAEMMDAAVGFAENSKRARQVSFAYPKLRRAELRRNVWRFATRRAVMRAIDTTTMLLDPAMWVAETTYFIGSIVSDESGVLWIGRAVNNLNNQPQNSTAWEPYFGPLTVSLYDSTLGYYQGELVYTASGDGTARIYLSLVAGNTDVPATPTAWISSATYMKNQVVTYSAVAYMSAVDLNTGNVPSSSPTAWAAGTTYTSGATVAGSDGVIYSSVGSGNIGHDPTTDGGANWTNTGVPAPWTRTFVGGAGSDRWLQIGGAEFPMGVGLTAIGIIYPIGSGPASQSVTRNVYRLPNGFLREAPQDPKAGSNSYLGAPSGLTYNDWLLEGDYIVTQQSDVILLRFVADITDVRRMDDMFCEGLAARIGEEVCETLTQSSAKVATITQAYRTTMSEARTVNAIETGSDEPPLDDYIACRA